MGAAQVRAQRTANEANLAMNEQTNLMNKQIADERNHLEIEMMREQNDWNLEQWNRENEYNSPEQQMQRLRDAGLNPLLFFGGSNSSGVSGTQSAVSPPSLDAPIMQAGHVEPEFGNPMITSGALNQIAGAFKNFGDYSKAMSESGLNSQQFSFVSDMSKRGINPELIKARTSLELFNQLVTSGKYQVPQIEAIIRDYNQRSNFNAWSAEVRRQEVDNLKEQYEGIRFTNKFNKDKAPLELAKLAVECRDIYLGTNIKASVAESQINLANQQAGLAQAQSGLVGAQTEQVEEQTQGVRYENAVKRLRAGLADMGINPDDKHLPFFMGLGLNIAENKIAPQKVSTFFDAVGDAELRSWKSLSEGHADLTKFDLYGQPSGFLGAGAQVNSTWKDIKDFFFRLGS